MVDTNSVWLTTVVPILGMSSKCGSTASYSCAHVYVLAAFALLGSSPSMASVSVCMAWYIKSSEMVQRACG